MHFCYPPFHNIAEMLVVDVEVLSPDRALCTLFELVLPMAAPARKVSQEHVQETYIRTSRSPSRTAMTLFNSFSCKPIRPARSSSFRLSMAQLLRSARNDQ